TGRADGPRQPLVMEQRLLRPGYRLCSARSPFRARGRAARTALSGNGVPGQIPAAEPLLRVVATERAAAFPSHTADAGVAGDAQSALCRGAAAGGKRAHPGALP